MFNLLTRKSIRKYQPNITIDDQQIENIIKDCQKAPSARNRQPIKFYVVKSKSALQAVRPLFPENFPHVDTCSILVFLMGDLRSYGITDASSENEIDKARNAILVDGGIMVNQMLQVVRLHGYEACAVGNFQKVQLNGVLNLDNFLIPILAVTIGLPDDEGKPYDRLDVKDIYKIL